MKIILLALLSFLYFSNNFVLMNSTKETTANTQANTAIDKDGWQLLFDGKTTNYVG